MISSSIKIISSSIKQMTNNMMLKLGKDKVEKLGVAIFVFLIETASLLLDALTNGWKPSLAGLCLSLVGLFITFYFCCVKTKIPNSVARKQLGTQEIVLSVIQLAASILHLLTFLLHRKEIFDVSVFIPLSFAIVAVVFAFYEEKIAIDGSSADLSTYRNSTPEGIELHEVITVNGSNSTNTSGLRRRPRQRTRGSPMKVMIHEPPKKREVPRIQNLRIEGKARLGEKLSGYPEFANGTSSCTFQWGRASSLLGGHRQRIEGATEQHYVVTVDDVDKLIALECIPVDDQGQQGEPFTVFADDYSKVECDPDLKREIERYTSNGEATFNVELQDTSTEQWEPATLIVSWPSYEIKINRTEAVVIRDHLFSEDAVSMETHNGHPAQFILRGPISTHKLRTDTDRTRDIIVLTMRQLPRNPSPVQLEAFSPSEEQIFHLLQLKVSGVAGRPEFDHMKEIELDKYKPRELQSVAYESGGEKYYFFAPIYQDEIVADRRAKGGIWEVMISEFKSRDGYPFAMKTRLIYYTQGQDTASQPVETDWCMKEYTLGEGKNNEESSWALCVVYLKRSPQRVRNLNL